MMLTVLWKGWVQRPILVGKLAMAMASFRCEPSCCISKWRQGLTYMGFIGGSRAQQARHFLTARLVAISVRNAS
jgi:hypothetical protein